MKNLICVLEDDKDIAELIEIILNDFGFQITCCPTVSDFHYQIQNLKPDLILLDVRLPDGNGLDVCKRLKSEGEFQDVPIIMMSAHLNDRSALIDSKADDFIPKPFDIHDLEERIRKLIGKV